ncbi:hypothetical protein RLEG12_16865 [Rhizobium leguminosarum bv. trifolii CB782]|nr:hypothetical protein RLEG12_16865 [Rhizobium leguminosarum bv. trifolii CB782]EJC73208.1 hypothetical protein Rleg10DRAFT_1660 [Rhizobium leguminosarum bv. trifolii WSM2012]PON08289.1 hypothetical protein ATY29_06140 [Rhizobium hidalgonense]RWX15740.1 hypothetical protein EHI42_14200 [Rhizobium hidalgonense]
MRMPILLKLTGIFINTGNAAKLPQHTRRGLATNACQSRGQGAPSLDKSERPCAFPPDFLVGA